MSDYALGCYDCDPSPFAKSDWRAMRVIHGMADLPANHPCPALVPWRCESCRSKAARPLEMREALDKSHAAIVWRRAVQHEALMFCDSDGERKYLQGTLTQLLASEEPADGGFHLSEEWARYAVRSGHSLSNGVDEIFVKCGASVDAAREELIALLLRLRDENDDAAHVVVIHFDYSRRPKVLPLGWKGPKHDPVTCWCGAELATR